MKKTTLFNISKVKTTKDDDLFIWLLQHLVTRISRKYLGDIFLLNLQKDIEIILILAVNINIFNLLQAL